MPFIIGTVSPARLSLIDAGNERGVFSLYGAALTTDNFDAQQTLWSTLVTKAMALVLGQKVTTDYGNKTDYAYTQPTNGAAREVALLVQGKDSVTGQRLTCKLPTLNLTAVTYVINLAAKDVVRTDTPSGITDFLTALAAFWVSPYTGNTVNVIGLKVVRGGK